MIVLSIIIATYNDQKTIGKLLDSVGQHPEVQVIVVDDRSQDNTQDIIRNKYPHVLLCQNKVHIGFPGTGRNTGIQIATGKYIWVLDSDDYLEEGAIQTVLSALESNQDVYHFNQHYIENKSEKLLVSTPYENHTVLDLLTKPLCQGLWSYVYKKEIIREYHIPDCIYEDLIILLRILDDKHKITPIETPVYTYTIEHESLDNSHGVLEEIDGAENVLNTILQLKLSSEDKKEFVYNVIKGLYIKHMIPYFNKHEEQFFNSYFRISPELNKALLYCLYRELKPQTDMLKQQLTTSEVRDLSVDELNAAKAAGLFPEDEIVLTVVAFSWNHAESIKQCIETFSPYKNVQLIIQENQSTDNSMEILDKLSEDTRYRFLYVINPPGAKQPVPMEEHFMAKGKYFWYISVEDRIMPKAVDQILTVIKHYNYPRRVYNQLMSENSISRVIENPKFSSDNNIEVGVSLPWIQS